MFPGITSSDMRYGNITLSYLKKWQEPLNPCLHNYDSKMDIVYARAFIAYMIGNLFFANGATSLRAGYLAALIDYDILGVWGFDWGMPIIAALYRGLDEVSVLRPEKVKKSITRFYAVLEYWFFEYCQVRIYLVKVHTFNHIYPRISGWRDERASTGLEIHHSFAVIRDMIEWKDKTNIDKQPWHKSRQLSCPEATSNPLDMGSFMDVVGPNDQRRRIPISVMQVPYPCPPTYSTDELWHQNQGLRHAAYEDLRQLTDISTELRRELSRAEELNPVLTRSNTRGKTNSKRKKASTPIIVVDVLEASEDVHDDKEQYSNSKNWSSDDFMNLACAWSQVSQNLTTTNNQKDARFWFKVPDGMKKEPESNVLLASIENLQYAVTVDVLHMILGTQAWNESRSTNPDYTESKFPRKRAYSRRKSEENTIEQILLKENSATSMLCNLKKRQPTLATSIELAKDVVSIVATLGKVGGENLSRLFLEYIGLDTMMAIVCKILKGVKALETYNKKGRINKTNDLQRRLALLKPRLPTGKCPHGFHGFSMKMIELESINLSCLAINGHGLRETLLYSLFSRMQVYKTRSKMQLALPSLSEGALFLDGGMVSFEQVDISVGDTILMLLEQVDISINAARVVAETEAHVPDSNTPAIPSREVLCTLVEKFRNELMKVWNWFQNRRYATKSKLVKSPGMLSISSLPRDDSVPMIIKSKSIGPNSFELMAYT
ncbi:hypothetical protein GIB67_035043 [Kingdonia uniflora]|uniref:Aminotransferase-like plant mobile domain-containing protein n=1 Tax=Kingdonia uniflora TaxID=39325 RepID=A0A7J7L1S0_9MAGN|nr:hypothetical protein GIB67_035043 [Kingdonia uniflora]